MKKKITAIIVCLSIALTISGCFKKPETPQSLAQSVAANLEKIKSLSLNMTMDFEAEITDGTGMTDESATMGMTMDLDIESTAEPEAAYLSGTMGMSVSGQRNEQEIESYLVEEDGETVSYTVSGESCVRQITDDVSGDAFFQENIYDYIADGDADAQLERETASIDNRSAYVLRTKLEGELLKDVMGLTVSGIFAQNDESDIDDIEADVTLYIYEDTKLPARVEIGGMGIGRFMEESVNSTGANMDVSRFDIIMEYTGFDNVDEIEVPADIKAGASDVTPGEVYDDIYYDGTGDEDSYGDDYAEDDDIYDIEDDDELLSPNADGSYTLYSDSGANAAVISLMDGQELSYNGDGYLATTSTDYSEESLFDYTYGFYDYFTLEEVAEYNSDYSWLDGMEEYTDITVGDVHEQDVNGMTVYSVKSSYEYSDEYGTLQFVDIYGWVQTGDEIFEIYISEYGDACGAEEELVLEAFENVEFDAGNPAEGISDVGASIRL